MAVSLRNSDDLDGIDTAPVSDINVTPLVDVMLVLLIVFMVAAPLMAVGVPVNLPKTQAKPLLDQKPPVAVSIDYDGKIYADKLLVSEDGLVPALKAASGGDDQRRIHVRGDKAVPYGQVIEAMGVINHSGFNKVALVSGPIDKK